MRKSFWLLSAALVAVPTPSFAQQADPGQPTQQAGPEGQEEVDQANTAGPGAVANTDIGQQPVDSSNIIITAQRRNQALSDVPLAVSAITAENLELSGAHDIRQLNQLSPSLLVSSTTSEGGAAVARIRGVGTVGDNPGLEGSVGIFIDGVYRSRAGMALTELGPLERIEVLRGPQGTLFGRNTSAGLISIITAQPRFQPEVSGAITYGNYEYWRAEASATGPISSTLAARIDGVWLKRDGFLTDVVSGRDVNDRDRWMLRGQLLYEPSSDLSVRIVGDYTQRREECCAAVFLPARDFTTSGAQPSTIKAIETALGGIINDDPFARKVSITPGQNYDSEVDDWGVSGEVNYDFGGANLTSITAYRYNKFDRGMDADFNNLDILHRDHDGASFTSFRTFTQELRLQGTAFDDRLDWLVGGYFANEKLRLDDNLSYGPDYQRLTNCVLFASVLPSAVNPLQPGCVNQTGPGSLGGTIGDLQAGIAQVQGAIALIQAAIANPATPPEQIPVLQAQLQGYQATLAGLVSSATTLGALDANPASPGFQSLAAVLGMPAFNEGAVALNDSWRQTSDNWAIFTHNIISITDQLKLTLGARYTHERKKLIGDLNDNNTLCVGLSSTALAPFQQLPCVIPGVPGGALDVTDEFSENKVSGTAVLSFKPTPDLLTYASYSRGYKGGGYNLDRSALWRANDKANGVSGSGAICASSAQPNCQGIAASGADLHFKPETNDAFEIGAKYNGPGFDLNIAVFHQLFTNFQLNTFNGPNFVVENINSCKDDLGGDDADADSSSGACTGDTRPGVKSQGVEIEAFTRPMRFLDVNVGVTYADTKYRNNLVGLDGKPLTSALFVLPGQRVSNSNEWTVTGAAAWTPPIPGTNLSGLVYADARYMTGFNTGSDLFPEKYQDAFTVVNGRIGIRGPNNAWSLEFWAQNLFDEKFQQVAFNAPIQGSGTQAGVEAGFYPRATTLFGSFLGEPRTFGVTLRATWSPPVAPPPVVAPSPPPPPEAPATQTCSDGTVILATDACPAPPPPPPPPPPAPERG